jgi:hypothetical protein
MVKDNLARLKRYYPMLLAFTKGSDSIKKHILKNAPRDFLATISDICFNIINGNVKMSPTNKKNLVKHKDNLRKLARKSLPIRNKKNFIIQNGGALSALIPAISIVTSLIANIISKKKRK